MQTPRHLLRLVLSQYRLLPYGIHGIAHWGRVLENGRRLAHSTGADLCVLEAFAILHDSQRSSEGRDPDHGPRAAVFAGSLRAEIGLTDPQFEQLALACECHTRGAPEHADTTVLTCLDADRLDLPRVGKRILPWRLSTTAAQDRETIAWASERALRNITPGLVRQEWGLR